MQSIKIILLTVLDTYQPVTLLLLPMYHIFATQVAMRMLKACHKFVIMPQFSADNLINALEKYQVNFSMKNKSRKYGSN